MLLFFAKKSEKFWYNFPVRGRPIRIWIIVGQGPTALAAGAGGLFGHFFSRLSFLTFSLSLGDGPI